MDAILIFWYECLFHVPFCVQESCTFCSIYIQEALPCPYGLVRSGVAPDHPDTKVCGWIQGRVRMLICMMSTMVHAECHASLSRYDGKETG